jgi:hypothetical protein
VLGRIAGDSLVDVADALCRRRGIGPCKGRIDERLEARR